MEARGFFKVDCGLTCWSLVRLSTCNLRASGCRLGSWAPQACSNSTRWLFGGLPGFLCPSLVNSSSSDSAPCCCAIDCRNTDLITSQALPKLNGKPCIFLATNRRHFVSFSFVENELFEYESRCCSFQPYIVIHISLYVAINQIDVLTVVLDDTSVR